jgi:thiol-disulfide isomerase/thioredoxin
LKAPNAVYVAVRDPDTLQTLILSSASSRRPLITLWTASWCSTCRQVLPLIQELIEQEKVGEAEGGVGLVEVEYDAPGNEEGGMRYMVSAPRELTEESGLIGALDKFCPDTARVFQR